jgi:signal transduction histidine kinase
VSAPADAAVHLSWLSPRTASLVELARASVAAWTHLRADPGLILLLLRQSDSSDFLSRIHDASVLEMALSHLDSGQGCIDWNDPALAPIYSAGFAGAQLAAQLAETTGQAHADRAWVACLLAPLGWYAVAATFPSEASACLAAPDLERYQLEKWGLDEEAIARRLCRSWQLPDWLSAIIGRLDLTPEAARDLGADVPLFRIVQLAMALVQEAGSALRTRVGQTADVNARELGFADEQRLALEEKARHLLANSLPASPWNAARDEPLLRELLLLAIHNRRLIDAPVIRSLERDADALHRALQLQHASEEERLHARKLSALAEFAAGAGHEINNPLAVISGQAQYLLNQEAEPSRQKSLQTIIGQAQRIHQILSDLMQFARPARPQPQPVRVSDVVRAVALKLQPFADQRRVRLEYSQADTPYAVLADPRQAQTALAALVRNGVEAAPAEGVVNIGVDAASADWIDLVVADSGGGPAKQHLEHLFDPFFSGRQAGRGRGLGLPTAWQLARVNQGSVVFAGCGDGVTRFILRLPRLADLPPVLTEPASEAPSLPANLPAMASEIQGTNGHLPSEAS